MPDSSFDSEFRFLADAVPAKVWRADANMSANYYNQEWFDFTGTTCVSELKKIIWTLIHPADLPLVQREAQRNLQSATSYEIEQRFRDKNGIYRWHLSKTKPVFDKNGVLTSWLGICVDIEEQKQSSEALRKNEQYFRFLADNTPVIIWRTGVDGSLNYISKQWEKFSGMPVADGFDSGWTKLLHEDDIPEVQKYYDKALRNREHYSGRFRLKSANNEYRWFLSVGLPVFDGETGFLGTLTDITEQEREHQHSNLQLKKMDEFVSIASHELKTPLTSLKLYLQLLDKNKTAEQTTFISRGLDQLKRLERLTSDLLDVSKISAGKLVYNIEEIDFAELIDDFVHTFRSWNVKHQVIVKNKSSVKLKGDRYRLEQVFANILSNAVKYSPGADRVEIDTYVQANYVITSIKDFGIGIADEDLARIFQRFYRVDATAMKYEGLGLGLFIVSEILIRHSGDFWIESELGKGSTFFFKLPINDLRREIIVESSTEYKDNQMAISFNVATGILEVDWIGFQDLESVKYGCLKMHELLKANNCRLVLNDNSNITGVSDASEWVGGQWFPMMEAAGLRHFAWVFSSVMFNNISAQKAVDLKQGNVITQFFTSTTEAREWLLSHA
ncbi:PAS domain-containing protein [Desertivirga brevis]|uniref:PAS domain-containing protein n=1 Tax=Desertivirga brevis TaxID=2810310 RepID=UPI001A96F963|nr:PAS domain-containing protein [Pedobacter sp. SYSU D00873]